MWPVLGLPPALAYGTHDYEVGTASSHGLLEESAQPAHLDFVSGKGFELLPEREQLQLHTLTVTGEQPRSSQTTPRSWRSSHCWRVLVADVLLRGHFPVVVRSRYALRLNQATKSQTRHVPMYAGAAGGRPLGRSA